MVIHALTPGTVREWLSQAIANDSSYLTAVGRVTIQIEDADFKHLVFTSTLVSR